MGETKECGHCGLWHSGPCPRVKSIEYYPNGTIKSIEYHKPEPQTWIVPTEPVLPEPPPGGKE